MSIDHIQREAEARQSGLLELVEAAGLDPAQWRPHLAVAA